MNKQFIPSEWENTAVHCTTNEESKKVNELIVELGGRDLHNNWSMYKEETCLNLLDINRKLNCYGDIPHYKSCNYRILTAQEFINTFKTQNMKKPVPFNITGNKYLIEAIGKELVEMGYKITQFKPSTTGVLQSNYDPCEDVEKFKIITHANATPYSNAIKFSLPIQYQKALDYCREALNPKNWQSEFKVGDIVVIQNDAQAGHPIGTIGKIINLDEDYARIVSHLSDTDMTMHHNLKNLRHATTQEIETFNKPVYKKGDYVVLTTNYSVLKQGSVGKVEDFGETHAKIWFATNYFWPVIKDIRLATQQEIEKYAKPISKTLVLGTSRISIEISKGKIMADGKEFSYDRLLNLSNKMEGSKSVGFADYTTSFPTIRIGCSDFSKEEIIKICNTYEEINGLSLTNYYPF